MSRITPPVTKLSHAVRSITSASRQSGRYAVPLKSTQSTASKHEQPFHTQTPHRPTSSPSTITIPLMQGFMTSSTSSSTPSPLQTIDAIVLPFLGLSEHSLSSIRVPLLPDNYSPLRSAHEIEALDTALADPEVHVVAANNPDTVAVLSEVEGDEALFVARGEEAGEREPGVLRELWSGVVEDIFGKGEEGGKPKLAG